MTKYKQKSTQSNNSTKFEKDIKLLINNVNEQQFGAAAIGLKKLYTSNSLGKLKTAANYEVVLEEILEIQEGGGVISVKSTLYVANTFKFLDYDKDLLWHTGITNTPMQLDKVKLIFTHTKTVLFNALLMIPGAEIVAKKMMDLDQKWLFNEGGTFATPPLCLVMGPDKNDTCKSIAKELVNRGGFKLDDVDLDRATGEKTPILEYLVKSQNNDLLSYMIGKGMTSYNFDKEYEIFSFPYLKSITPLMIFVCSGNFEAVKMLVESGVNLNHKVTSSILTEKELEEQEYNALSFTKTNMEIAEYLIDKGSKFLGTTLGLVGALIEDYPSLFIDKIGEHTVKLTELLAARVYYEEAIKLIHNVGSNKEEIVDIFAKVEELSKNRCVSNKVKAEEEIEEVNDVPATSLAEEKEDLDTLLLKYFITKDEVIADEIRQLCIESPEHAMSLVATLNSQYLENTDTNELVGNLLCDPLLIQKYFEDRKSLVQAKMLAIEAQKNGVQQDCWELKDVGSVSMDEVIPVKTTMNCNVYIKISDDISAVVGTGGFSNLKIVPQDSLGINGIKFRNDLGIIVVKTKALGDDRLVAEGIYKNKLGDMLIYCNHMCNHTKVENWSKSTENHENTDSISLSVEKIIFDENNDSDIIGETNDGF